MHPELSNTHTKEKATLNGSLFCFSETLLNLWKQNTKQMKKANGRHTVQYVHQLQNLYFALTGKELEFKL